jgi:hypothetical protein
MSPGPEDLISQREKRSILENDKRVREQGTTYSSFAEAFADEERGGRFAAINKTNVIGTAAAPQYPEGPAWCADRTGAEPALGVDINEMPPTGEPHELKASITDVEVSPLERSSPFSAQGTGGAVPAPTSVSASLAGVVEPAAPPSFSDDDEPPPAA